MALTSTNTYIEPTAGTAFNTARLQQNDNFRSLLTNFRSTSAPTSVNLTASGNPLAVPDGMLYRSATTNALYIADAARKKTARVGGNFTRVGIGTRLEDSYQGLTANASTYEIGELAVIASADTGKTGHGSVYLCAANSGTITDFVLIGGDNPYTVDINDNVTFTGQSIIAPIVRTTANVGIRTATPAQDLHVVGNALVTTDVLIGSYIIHNGDTNTYTGFPANDTYVVFTSGVERVRVASTGRVGIGTASPTSTLHVVGDALVTTNVAVGTYIVHSGDTNTYTGFPTTDTYVVVTNGIERVRVTSTGLVGIGTSSPTSTLHVVGNAFVSSDFTSGGDVTAYSDARLKENVVTVDNALDKVLQMRGVYFNKIGQEERQVGVIAQEVEAIVPELVKENADGMKSVAYGNAMALLIEAIKELKSEIDQLKAER